MSLIRKDYTLSSYNENSWIVEIFGQHFIINHESKSVLEILSVSETYDEAVGKFNTSFKDNLNTESFIELVKNIFSKIPIFDNDRKDANPQKSFIKFQKTIITSELAKKLINPFRFLFIKKIFWTLFIGLSILAVVLVVKTPLSSLQEVHMLWIALLYTPTVFLHELGHIAACNKYTHKNGEIGFGIYFIFPVFYSDVSAIWHAKKEERVITNLAGIYLQMLSMLIFIVLHYFTNNSLFLQMAFILAVYSYIQLIPFIRSDGYWLLSDLSSTPNLHERSQSELKMWLTKPLKKITQSTPKEYFILLYGIFNTVIFGYFIITQIVYQWRDLLNFPIYIYNSVISIFKLNFSDLYLAPNIITIIIFYIICFRYINKIFTKKA
ncbi:hypothetical protein LNP04_14065 [Chryseobacterium sp. C-71]|uniref:hypothetical protein n=1 Tax=Chryseobacterium sp. C-71 TaxID=2893882 RepID=UPI001E2B0033|nr:hypothetical protein [Chryseobacterium sp. C-71]UFH31093.1 hypothetical protein LNP04_14065 [Chryseobacterium sp. C-71]